MYIASHPNGSHTIALLRKTPISLTRRGAGNLGEARRFLNREIGSESVRGALEHGANAGIIFCGGRHALSES